MSCRVPLVLLLATSCYSAPGDEAASGSASESTSPGNSGLTTSAVDPTEDTSTGAGTSGAWTANNALHFRVFSGVAGELIHSIYAGTGYTTVIYSSEIISKVYRYLPPGDGPDGGIRDVITYTWTGEYLTGGDV